MSEIEQRALKEKKRGKPDSDLDMFTDYILGQWNTNCSSLLLNLTPNCWTAILQGSFVFVCMGIWLCCWVCTREKHIYSWPELLQGRSDLGICNYKMKWRPTHSNKSLTCHRETSPSVLQHARCLHWVTSLLPATEKHLHVYCNMQDAHTEWQVSYLPQRNISKYTATCKIEYIYSEIKELCQQGWPPMKLQVSDLTHYCNARS